MVDVINVHYISKRSQMNDLFQIYLNYPFIELNIGANKEDLSKLKYLTDCVLEGDGERKWKKRGAF